ncbi:hypothetical protein C8A01DRAFT_32232 [Parachaetomium inaequale]|uniref:Uncharacterized protein n=1 Tax=Parachaetomium inaequale TaxID=2588326 RepID=A0AAN6SVL4_9PEZI|nr:hypothetical protein C8A01DRAFT_32232 [Parachaetomium inaequale]
MQPTTLTTLLATAGLVTGAALLPKMEVGPVMISDTTATPAAHQAAATPSTATVIETITRSQTPTLTPTANAEEMMPAVSRPVITTSAVSPHHLQARAEDWRAARDKAISRGRQAGSRGRAKGAEGRRKGQAAAANDNERRGWQEDVASAKSLAASYRASASSVAASAQAEASSAVAEWRDHSSSADNGEESLDEQQSQHNNNNSTAVPEQQQPQQPSNATVVPESSANATTAHEEPRPSEVPTVQVNGAEAQPMDITSVVVAGFAVVAAAFGMM